MLDDHSGCIIYNIGRHETLSDIFRRFDISIKDIMEYNAECDIFSLREGQTLLIKDKKRSAKRTYVLKEDETVWTVARKFDISVPFLLNQNANLLPNEIRQGIRISLPE